ncbi:glycosyltransferase [Moorena sp. SIO3I6]|uniref:glycosyltransferase n=1 Tax=Moorena sp. SIO3I6 TaxID=2607831 RepID=UPI0013FABA7F|nr:glycosyltransferase [Moorena sp. SIO3I6]NEP21081.1 glycosyltransferase [Moorena sp. SIO3I6]
MTHFGIICPPASSHLNLMTTLGYELKQRGHRVTVLGIEDVQEKVLAAGLEFQVIGKSDFPKGTTKDIFTKLGNLSGIKAFKYTINSFVNVAKMSLRDAPEVIKTAGIELLLVDQASPEGGTIADYLDIPFVSVSSSLIFNREISVPPVMTSWNYDPSWRGILRNRLGYVLVYFMSKSLRKVIGYHRKKWNLSSYNNVNEQYSQLAQISQEPPELEFPRKELPSCFHFTGPYHYSNSASRESIPFPYDKLTGQPLIYASMGTLQNQLLSIFSMIAEACVGLDAQLVIGLGGGTSPESLPELPVNPIVVGYAPQLELLKKATLTITHGGTNTVIESLTNGVPMVAIPITNDQPGVAARIAWTGTGEVIPLGKVRVEKLQKAIKRVLTEDSYKKNALRLQEAITRAGGVSRAADIIEQVVATGKPVISEITTQH